MWEHPHLHCLVTGGALSKDRQQWRSSRRGYLFPVRALSAVLRAKYGRALQRAFTRGQLPPRAALPMLAEQTSFGRYLQQLQREPFVVYAKRPLAGPAQVIAYLGRYTHRVAITNRRIAAIEEGQVSFVWKDYRDGERQKVLTLPAVEFIRRFLLHVLPAAFVRIRHYGLLAHEKAAKLARCRELLNGAGVERRREEPSGEVGRTTGEAEAPWRCVRCGVGEMVRRAEWSEGAGPPAQEWVHAFAA